MLKGMRSYLQHLYEDHCTARAGGVAENTRVCALLLCYRKLQELCRWPTKGALLRVQKSLSNNTEFKRAYQAIKNGLSMKGQRAPGGVCPQAGTTEHALDQEQHTLFAKYLIKCALRARTGCLVATLMFLANAGSCTPPAPCRQRKTASARLLALCLILFACVARGDEARLMHLSDILAPRQVECIGAQPATKWKPGNPDLKASAACSLACQLVFGRARTSACLVVRVQVRFPCDVSVYAAATT